ncbi:MAG: hypothetical protein K9H25_03345 [Rhodospirillum sp.]|nr:hypothetical protein [Rhodospirillum sp.]MCF8487575.1 hypothetical protein [Rhodospirillum sp.]MCF8499058.1 hypothetical protein [Rhodospirillum sp.]
MADDSHTTTPNGFSAVVLSSRYETVHYALILASAAAAIGKPSVLFFSMGACRALAARLEATRSPKAEYADAPGWHDLASEPAFPSAKDQDRHYIARGIADMETLLTSCAALGTRFIVCEAGLRSIDLAESALRADLPIEVAGAVTWLTESPVGAITLLA